MAALIAAAAVWQQLAFERYKFNLAEVRREEIERDSLQRVIEYYRRMLDVFDDAKGAPDIRFVNGLDNLYKSGRLAPFFGSLPAGHQALARDVWERLGNLNHALVQARTVGASGVGDLAARTEINQGLAEVAADIRHHSAVAKEALN